MTFEQLNTAHASDLDTGEIPSPATPEGEAISRAAAIAAAEVFNGPVSDSDFVNGQATAAQQIVAALRSLPPQNGERELRAKLKTARKIIAKVYGRVALVVSELIDDGDKVSLGSTNHADILRDLDQEWAETTILKADILTSEQEAAAYRARAEKAEARVAELENALDSRGKELTAAWHRIEGLTAQPVAQDLAPEATEACAEQTEIVIKALQAAKREIDPRFAGHHENIGFAIRRLRCLTQSFQDACRENDALRTRATPAPVEAVLRWNKTADGLPQKPGKRDYEQIECLIILPNGDLEISVWNCEHLVWDDAEGDDFRYDPGYPTHWIALAPFRAAIRAQSAPVGGR